MNLGRDLHWHPNAEPLVAPPPGMDWSIIFSSDDPQYGGAGTAVLNTRNWNLPGHATVAGCGQVVTVPLPDVKGRMEILKVHARKVKLGPELADHGVAEHQTGRDAVPRLQHRLQRRAGLIVLALCAGSRTALTSTRRRSRRRRLRR